MSKSIPGVSRALVRGRDRHHCIRCGMRGVDWHHRRTRSVRDEHTHCPCNGITLCGPGNNHGCHGWAHSNPAEAAEIGLIVSRHSLVLPREVPVQHIEHGLVLLNCDGGFLSLDQFSTEPEEGTT